MKIFVTGASGYIGSHVSAALRRAGYDVWGLTRTEAKARLLARCEVHPVIGSLQEPNRWLGYAADCGVIIHCAADYTVNTWELDRDFIQQILALSPHGSQPKMFVYTSGVWVYGSTGSRAADETSLLNPPAVVAPRVPNEELVMNADNVRPLVMRPGMVYGKQGGSIGLWFASMVKNEMPLVVGDGDNFWTMVHVEDLAEAYALAVEIGLSDELFNITDRSRWRVREMVSASAKVAGFKNTITYTPVDEAAAIVGPMAQCLALDQHVDSRKAVRLLGWQPKHGGFVDEVDTYFAAWQAAQEKV
jgi:nucleoside-diphosphate-sugar epimerase